MRRKRTQEPAPPATGPTWGARFLWGAIGLIAGYVGGLVLSLLLLSVVGRDPARFIFRVCAYGGIFAGIDYGGERPRLRSALLRGFGLGALIALLRSALGML